jgi:uncharacterized protein YuzE
MGKKAEALSLSPSITVELNNKNEMIGVEILNAKEVLLDMLQESL